MEPTVTISICTQDHKNHAITAIIEELAARGTDMKSLAEATRLRILGSPSLYMLPAEYRVSCADAAKEMLDIAAQDSDDI